MQETNASANNSDFVKLPATLWHNILKLVPALYTIYNTLTLVNKTFYASDLTFRYGYAVIDYYRQFLARFFLILKFVRHRRSIIVFIQNSPLMVLYIKIS